MKRNAELLKNAKEDSFAKPTYAKLIEDTFVDRRSYIKYKAKSVAECVENFPFLRKPEHVSYLYLYNTLLNYSNLIG